MKKQTYQKPELRYEMFGIDVIMSSLPDNFGDWIWGNGNSEEEV